MAATAVGFTKTHNE